METFEDKIRNQIFTYLAPDIYKVLFRYGVQNFENVEEIRLRAGKPLFIRANGRDFTITEKGQVTKEFENPYITSQSDIIKTFEIMSENSVYAYLDEIRNGFITLKGGHRVGFAGRVIAENQSIKNIKDIASLNIRISRQVLGCSRKLLKHIITGKHDIANTLIVSPPGCGKTTLLRDIARNLSDGIKVLNFSGTRVGIVDERSEICACFKGVPQHDVGVRTDVMDTCPKSFGINTLLRCMSPEVILFDELGTKGDLEACMNVVNSGVKIICTAHGYSILDIKMRKEILDLIESRVFERIIVLSSAEGPGTIEEIVNGLTLGTIFRRYEDAI